MKIIKSYNNFVNESIKDLMKGKSKDELIDSLNKLSIKDKFNRACEFGLIDVVKTLLKTNKDEINMEESFETAVIYDQLNIAKLLISKGINIRSIDAQPMIESCTNGDNLIKFKFLLDLDLYFFSFTTNDMMYELAEQDAPKCLTEAFKRGFEMEYFQHTNLEEDKIDYYFFDTFKDEIIRIIIKYSKQIREQFEECANKYIDRANKIKSYLK
jgi:predicted transposase